MMQWEGCMSRRGREREMYVVVKKNDMVREKAAEEESIKESRFNEYYGWIMPKERGQYLCERRENESQELISRRCDCAEYFRMFWLSIEKSRCECIKKEE